MAAPPEYVDRRHFLKLGGLTAVMLSRAAAWAAAEGRAARKPNIVVILSDDVGYGDLGCYGAADVRTPRLDQFARDGLRFTAAHSDAATCTPSRYALLTGSYAWRHDGVAILPGDAKLLIEPGQTTIASMLKAAGYTTGLVGKWHIGLGDGKIDWNGEIRPGPCEVGFDEAFFFPATADRVPTVYVHNHRVVGADPKDPIQVSYADKIGHEPTGREDPELLKMKLTEDHDGTIVDGISRIGYMTGGKAARWKDEEIAQTFAGKAVEFIEKHQHEPFFLYFTPSDIHVPRAPGAQFAGKSGCGVRCDVINQLDWSVGQVLDALKRCHLDEDTLVVFTSDNGPVLNDGYDDGADRQVEGHKPAGPFRGGKYTIMEGGTAMPFLVRWTGHVKPGVSDALMTQVDLLASFADLVHQPVPKNSAADSLNMLPALLGKSSAGREAIVEESQVLAIREGKWKLIDRSQKPGAHPPPPAGNHASKPNTKDAAYKLNHDGVPTAPLELYDLSTDPHEMTNIAEQHPEVVKRLRERLAQLRSQGHS